MSKNFIVLLPLIFWLVKSVKYDGIDVSEHQEVIDFERVKKSGINFVIMRAGIGHGRKDN